jgi:hypothetical protein
MGDKAEEGGNPLPSIIILEPSSSGEAAGDHAMGEAAAGDHAMGEEAGEAEKGEEEGEL